MTDRIDTIPGADRYPVRVLDFDPDYRPTPKTYLYCVHCSRDLNPAKKAAAFLVVSFPDDAVELLLHPEDRQHVLPQWTVRASLMGMDCARAIPAEWRWASLVAPADLARYDATEADDMAEGNKGRRGGVQPGSGRPKLSPDETTERLNCSVPASLKARVAAYAEAHAVTTNAAAREILEAGLAAIEARPPPTLGDP